MPAGDMEEIKITYEVLFDILRREKNREELQHLDEDFFEQTRLYLVEKEKLASLQTGDAEAHRHAIQAQNIRKILKELYERRERKLINMALAEVRSRRAMIDKSAILPEESGFFQQLIHVLRTTRAGLVDHLLQGKLMQPAAPPAAASYSPSTYPPSNRGSAKPSEQQAPARPRDDAPAPQPEQEKPAQSDPVAKTVRILQAIPKFVGTEMEVYGPFKQDDVASLPKLIADVLIRKGRAEEVET